MFPLTYVYNLKDVRGSWSAIFVIFWFELIRFHPLCNSNIFCPVNITFYNSIKHTLICHLRDFYNSWILIYCKEPTKPKPMKNPGKAFSRHFFHTYTLYLVKEQHRLVIYFFRLFCSNIKDFKHYLDLLKTLLFLKKE